MLHELLFPAPPPRVVVQRREPVYGSHAADAITLGRYVDREEGVAEKMRYGGNQHVVVFGANGKGKGTRFLMPNLLQIRDASLVVIDPKGELAAVTAPYRRELGRVVILNPFGVLTDIPSYQDLRSQGFNPLARLDPDKPSFNAQAGLIAEAMVPVQGNDPHWSLSARALVAALVMYATIEARKLGKAPTIARVRELLCQASDAAHAGNNWQAVGIPKLAEEMARSKIAGLRNKAAQFTDWNREIQSIASTARIQTEPFDDPEIAADLARDSFDFRTLKREPVTVYLVLPPDMMQRHAKWLRLVLTAAIQSVMRPRRPGEPKVIFALDEFFALGHMEIISTVWSLTRGYGVQMLPILQSLLQLKKLEPEMWENFLGMAGAVLSFGANDLTSAEWLSRRAGETTRNVATFSESTSTTDSGGSTTPGFGSSSYGSTNSGWSTSSNKSTSFAPAKTALITSHRMMGLRSGFGLVALDGVSNLIPAYLPAYYEVRETAFRARRNPYYLP